MKTKAKKVQIDDAVKELVKAAHKRTDEQFKLPIFNLQKLLDYIQSLVDIAPDGIVTLVIDLFCGAGGTSEGIEQAKARHKKIKKMFKCSAIIAGINHDAKAIYSQSVNHPLAYYTDEDIRFANLVPVQELVDILRARFPNCPVIIWASWECTNHSNAKGGLARDPDSRSLPNEIFRYIEAINPDGVWGENVKEFSQWGPMMPKVQLLKGKRKVMLKDPIPEHLEMEFYEKKIADGFVCTCPLEYIKKEVEENGKKKKKKKIVGLMPAWRVIDKLKGTYYLPWVEQVKSYGYNYDSRIINAADHGVPQNRKRLFLIFMREGWPILWPTPTHAKNPKPGDLFNQMKPHIPVKECLDFAVEGESVFKPGHVKSDKTWERIFEGLVKFIAGGKQNYMLQRNGGQPSSKVFSTDDPARTATQTGGNQDVVQPVFITKYMGNNKDTGSNSGASIENPSNAITAQVRLGLVKADILDKFWLHKYNSSHNNTKQNAGNSIDESGPTVTTFGSVALMNTKFLNVDGIDPTLKTEAGDDLVDMNFLLNYQGQSNASDINEKSPAIMTKEKLALMGVKHFIYKAYTNSGTNGSIDNPRDVITPIPKPALMSTHGFIMSQHFDNKGSSLDRPAPAQTASRKHNYMVNMSWGGHVSSDGEPSVTIVARQDKAPIYLCSINQDEYSLIIPVLETDSEAIIKVKEFMVLYNIVDIKKRMLMVKELKKIQSFPESYYLGGSQTDQKKFIGNAVPPLVAKAIAESMYGAMKDHITKRIIPFNKTLQDSIKNAA